MRRAIGVVVTIRVLVLFRFSCFFVIRLVFNCFYFFSFKEGVGLVIKEGRFLRFIGFIV